MKSKSFIFGITIGILITIGCATTFPYRYYATQMPDTCYDHGMLLGSGGGGGWPDMPLNNCKPDPLPSPGVSPIPGSRHLKCITVLVDDFYSLKADDQKCHSDLQACLRGRQP